MQRYNQSKIKLNVVPVKVDPDTTIRIGVQPYRNKEQLEELWSGNRDTHFFKRKGDKVFSISLSEECDPIGEEIVEVKIAEQPEFIASLVLNSLKQYFVNIDRTVTNNKPLRILSNRKQDNLLAMSVPKGVNVPSWLEMRVSYIFDTRVLYIPKKPPVVVLSCDVRVCNRINASCRELIQAGIPIEGRYVERLEQPRDPKLTPKRRLVGKIKAIKGNLLVLTDHQDGFEMIPLTDAYLEPRYENLIHCISHLSKTSVTDILQQLDRILARLRSGPERLRHIEAVFKHLRSQHLKLTPTFEFTLGEMLSQGENPHLFPRFEIIPKPILVFDPSGTRTDTWNERGLDQHGPYSKRRFTPIQPKIAVICQKCEQGKVEQFIKKFLEGMPNVFVQSKSFQRAPYGKGFIRRFALDDVQIKFFLVENSEANAYIEACKQAISHSSNYNEDWNLVIVQTEKDFRQLYGNKNPYLVTKCFFLQQQIPVQEVEIENIVKDDRQLIYILNNISLASYAKMGGTPWLLKADSPIAHELVFGLGSCQVSRSRLGPKERVVGITTVFTGDGNYLLTNKSAAVPFDEYPKALLRSLRETVATVKEDQNWLPNDSVRLIFHLFKPFKDIEVRAIKTVMQELGHYDTQYAFIHFVDNHPFHVFDENNKGVKDYLTHQIKGRFAPPRGAFLTLSKWEALLSFKGSREVKRLQDGIPQPVLLRLHRDSTFTDLTYLARQSFDFSCHSWRSFSPAPLPITILYSALIAKLLKNLSSVSGWNPDVILGRIGRTRWFL